MKGIQDMWTQMRSPMGDLRIVTTRRGDELRLIEFTPFVGLPEGEPMGQRRDDQPLLVRAVAQLNEYFTKERRNFDLPLPPKGSLLALEEDALF